MNWFRTRVPSWTIHRSRNKGRAKACIYSQRVATDAMQQLNPCSKNSPGRDSLSRQSGTPHEPDFPEASRNQRQLVPTFERNRRTAGRRRDEARTEGSRIPGICIVLSYFSVGTRIVWHRIIAFMANKRKAAPVRPARCLRNDRPLDRSILEPSSTSPVPTH